MPESKPKRRKAISDFSKYEIVFVNGDKPLQANDPVLLAFIKETENSYQKETENSTVEKK